MKQNNVEHLWAFWNQTNKYNHNAMLYMLSTEQYIRKTIHHKYCIYTKVDTKSLYSFNAEFNWEGGVMATQFNDQEIGDD